MDPIIEEILRNARTVREGTEHFGAVLVYKPVNGEPMVAPLALSNDGTLDESVTEVGLIVSLDLGPAEWVASVADMFFRYTIRPLSYESLSEAFEAGDPNVAEQIFIQLARRGGPSKSGRQVYRYHPVDGYEWDPWVAAKKIDIDSRLQAALEAMVNT